MLRLILPLLFLAIQSALVISRDEDICSQEIATGRCMAYIERYAFNNMSRRCEKFIFGGCGGNKNNFLSLEKCQKVCYKECTLPKDSGICLASMPRYYYNKKTRKCEKFIYGGCGGNENNFESEKDCEARCVITNKVDLI